MLSQGETNGVKVEPLTQLQQMTRTLTPEQKNNVVVAAAVVFVPSHLLFTVS